MPKWKVTSRNGRVTIVEAYGFALQNGGCLLFTNELSGNTSPSMTVAAFSPESWVEVHRHNEGDKE